MGVLRQFHQFHLPTLASVVLLLLLPFFVFSADQPPYSCGGSSDPATENFDFCKMSLPIEKRVDDLISRLTMEEKIAQLGDIAPPIPRLGIPGYKWWSEALHGVSVWGRGIHFNGTIKGATSFPQVILTAATFNPKIWYQIGQVIGTEARALYNNGQAEGLTFWSPNVNIFRDPRWGRGQETPGEDPKTASRYAAYFVRGMQGDSYRGGASSVKLKTSACCKHFTAYDLDDWNGFVRYTFNAKVSAQDMADTYQPPFRSCIKQGRASCIMCSYNEVNGVPTCADYKLLTKTARGRWGLQGYISTDCDSIALIHGAHGYAKTDEDAVADALKAGVDVNCGDFVQKYAGSAVQQGKLLQGDLDRALHNLFLTRMRLGLFDGKPEGQIYGGIDSSQVCSQDHQNLALEAARDGIVLLKNSANLLPLSKSKVTSLGVIGPNANNIFLLLANYAGPPCKYITPLQALTSYAKDTRYVPACSNASCTSASIDEAVALARSVDYVVMFMGLDQDVEKEGLDRVDLVLPGMQQNLIKSVAEAAKKPVILVLLCGGPVDINFAKLNEKIGSILWAGYPGESGGIAIAQVIFGEHNPGGRLPVTWYPQEFTGVPMNDMRMRADPATGFPGRTYRFYTGKPVFNFGYGLSYSNYSYEFKSTAEFPVYGSNSMALQSADNMLLSYDITKIGKEACSDLEFPVVVSVKNHGPMAGRHPVLLYARWPTTEHGRPIKQLISFENVHLEAGEMANVTFSLRACDHLARAHADGSEMLDMGPHFLVVGEEEHKITIMP